MMVSFLKSSHGLASQRRPGRDENLIHSGSKIRKHDTVWRHILVFLSMMLSESVGSAAHFAFQEHELSTAFYDQFTMDNYNTGRNPSGLEDILKDIIGIWRIDNSSETEIAVSGNAITSSFFQCAGNRLKVRFRDRPTYPRLVTLNGKERLVLMVEQSKALWIITPMRDSKSKLYMRWHSNKIFAQRRRRDFDYHTRLIKDEFHPLGQPDFSQRMRGGRQHNTVQRAPRSQRVVNKPASAPRGFNANGNDSDTEIGNGGDTNSGTSNNSSSRSPSPTHEEQENKQSDLEDLPKFFKQQKRLPNPLANNTCWIHANCPHTKGRKTKYRFDPKDSGSIIRDFRDISEPSRAPRGFGPVGLTFGSENKCWNCGQKREDILFENYYETNEPFSEDREKYTARKVVRREDAV